MNPSPSIGLDRDRFKCFLCPINEQSTVHCVIHPQQKAVLCTYLRNFTLIERRGFFAISQNLHRQVYCPESAVCDKVRQLSLIFFSMGNEFFVVCERFKKFFFVTPWNSFQAWCVSCGKYQCGNQDFSKLFVYRDYPTNNLLKIIIECYSERVKKDGLQFLEDFAQGNTFLYIFGLEEVIS